MEISENQQQTEEKAAPAGTAKRKKTLPAVYLAFLCRELAMVLDAGIPLGDGLDLLIENEKAKEYCDVLRGMSEGMKDGKEFSAVVKEAGVFPDYLMEMVTVGEQTGNMDVILLGLSDYYTRQEELFQSIKGAIIYPVILFVMMLMVITVLVTKVLPVFQDVLNQLGTSLSAGALTVMKIGLAVGKAWIVIPVLGGVIIAGMLLLFGNEKYKARLLDRGFSKKIGTAVSTSRFAAVMAMCMKGGLNIDESLKLAEGVITYPPVREKVKKTGELMLTQSFADSVTAAGLLPPVYTTALAVGEKTGAADTVMDSISRRLETDAQAKIDAAVGRVEPTLVLVMSLLIGLILLTVMIPLINIMSTL